MAQKKKNNYTPQNGKKLWLRIAILLVALIMVLGIVIVPFIS